MEFQALGLVGVLAIGCLGVYTTLRTSASVWRASHTTKPVGVATVITLAVAWAMFLGGWLVVDVIWVLSRLTRAARRFLGGRELGVT